MSNTHQTDNQYVTENSKHSISNEEEDIISEEIILNGQNNSVESSEEPQLEFVENCHENEMLSTISEIRSDVEKLEDEIKSLNLSELQEKYRFYEEILIQKTIKLDNIETMNSKKIKACRKNAVLYIQECLQEIDKKLGR